MPTTTTDPPANDSRTTRPIRRRWTAIVAASVVTSAIIFATIIVTLFTLTPRRDDHRTDGSRRGGGHLGGSMVGGAPYQADDYFGAPTDSSGRRRRRRLLHVPPDLDPQRAPIQSAFVKSQGFGYGHTDEDPFRILFVVTTLSEYDKGTRGTSRGSDRLQNVMIPVISDAVTSMVEKGWHVDVFLILGYESLRPERRKLIADVLPPGVGLEVWEDAIPFWYNGRSRTKREERKLELASHGLSRQHRYVVRDKLMQYDFFACFEDDMRITADHVLNFLELSTGLEQLRIRAESSPDGMVHVANESHRDPAKRGKSMDKAPVGNDVVDDPITAEYLKRVIPGFVRAEVLDREPNHPLRGDGGPLDTGRYKFAREVPPDLATAGSIDPDICCGEDPPGRGKMTPNPTAEDLVLWETNVGAMGVRHYPEPVGWVGSMPVEDRADVGSYWSGEGGVFNDPSFTRPRRLDSTLGQQAGFMATRSQVLYFDEVCPGGFLPPFEGRGNWVNDDTLQRHAVEFWSGGFQLFGQCFLNRIVSLDPDRFSRHLLYHTANNKQRTKRTNAFTRAVDYLGQLHTVKGRAERSLLA